MNQERPSLFVATYLRSSPIIRLQCVCLAWRLLISLRVTLQIGTRKRKICLAPLSMSTSELITTVFSTNVRRRRNLEPVGRSTQSCPSLRKQWSISKKLQKFAHLTTTIRFYVGTVVFVYWRVVWVRSGKKKWKSSIRVKDRQFRDPPDR